MKTFRDWVALREEMWMTAGPIDGKGTHRQGVIDMYNHRFTGGGGAAPSGGTTPSPQPPPKKQMKK